MLFQQLYDAKSWTYTYLLADEDTREAVIIDPVIDQVERDATLIDELGLELVYALDTHVHADHVTATGALRDRLACKTVISEHAGVDCADVQVKDGDVVTFGRHQLVVRETPGHTDGCVSYLMPDRAIAFTGDALLIRSCGRTDFQQGDARKLYRSVHGKLFTLPASTTVYPAHDYNGRTSASIGEELRLNPRLGSGKTEDEFVEIMDELKLPYPKQIDVALPRNLHCGAADQATDPQWYPLISATGVPEVTPAWVVARAHELRIIDVRQPAEFSDDLGHIAGAELVPLDTVATAAVPVDSRPVVVVCRSGGRSEKAVELFRKLGVERVASMEGGMAAWSQAKLPIQR